MQSQQLPLNILSATFGKADVTAKVRSFANQGSLSVKADNNTLGDGWPGFAKALVVVYQYTYYKPEVLVVKEGDTLNINSQNYKYHPWLLPPQGTLAILGAAYGLGNVTDTIAGRVHGNSLDLFVDNNLGDTWSGMKKLLVVTYLSNFGTPVTVTAEEGTQLKINNEQSNFGQSPAQKAHLTILGAAFGKRNITDQVRGMINQDAVNFKADNGLFGGDPWPGIAKSLVVVYQYGLHKPEVAITHEGSTININPQSYKYQQWFPPGQGQFSVLGASFGLANVTDAVNSKVKGNFLDLPIDNNNLGDGWSGVKKSFVAVAVNNKGVPVTIIREEGEHLKLDQNAGY